MAKKKTRKPIKFIPCTTMALPPDQQIAAADMAVAMHPGNAPMYEAVAMTIVATAGVEGPPLREHLAFLTGMYWGNGGVDLSVSFLDNPTVGFRNKWLAHANSWSDEAGGNVKFRWSQSGGQVRVARQRGSGYWSYLGVGILQIAPGQATMNLDSFTENTPESEWTRVVRHEVGHTLGAPHEHLRQAIVNRLDVAKTLEYFRRTQGWSDQTTRANVLTPISESSILGSELTDEDSIMAYQLPASITKNGQPIRGGANFSSTDKAFVAKVYPKAAQPPPPAEAQTTISLVFEKGKPVPDFECLVSKGGASANVRVR